MFVLDRILHHNAIPIGQSNALHRLMIRIGLPILTQFRIMLHKLLFWIDNGQNSMSTLAKQTPGPISRGWIILHGRILIHATPQSCLPATLVRSRSCSWIMNRQSDNNFCIQSPQRFIGRCLQSNRHGTSISSAIGLTGITQMTVKDPGMSCNMQRMWNTKECLLLLLLLFLLLLLLLLLLLNHGQFDTFSIFRNFIFNFHLFGIGRKTSISCSASTTSVWTQLLWRWR
mmetsp:Transcript_1997/g.2688  ORF Transcript_1997/g.2688 Transcript_1997/m.2688 type:complete len:229 (+) Transcript_1997:3688-4374(+)